MDDARFGREVEAVDEAPACETPLNIGGDERRMHVRAYNYWVSLLAGRPFPAVRDLDPARLGDFGPHGVLLDFSVDPDNPTIRFLGSALAAECALGEEIRTIADVPPRSLLSRLTDHHLQIIANRAPIGFEAEFVSQRGHNTMYRGILMPFSSDGGTIDFLYGVINWKELADEGTASALMLAVDREMRAPAGQAAQTLWADGPDPAAAVDASDPDVPGLDPLLFEEPEGLADHLAAARDGADAVRKADGRSRAALYRALGLAYDFARVAETRPDEFAELCADSGVTARAGATMTPVVKLVFGGDYDKSRLTEFAAVLAYARRSAVAPGALSALIERQAGGMKALVAAERKARQPRPRRGMAERALDALRQAPVRATIDMAADGEEFVLLIARREPAGGLGIVAPVPADPVLLERAVRLIAR